METNDGEYWVEEVIESHAQEMNLIEALNERGGCEDIKQEIYYQVFKMMYKIHPEILNDIIDGNLDFYLSDPAIGD